MKDLIRFLAGPQPVLRLIAVLLMVIAGLLYAIWDEVRWLPEPPTCGSSYEPCAVRIQD